MKKHIEEMTKDLCDIECKGMKCNECDGCGCEYRVLAEALTAKGYRKASDVAEEVLNALKNRIREAWGARTMFMPPRDGYAWNDEFIDVKTVYKFIAELKKKYTEEGK